jgi:hypothetical protein
MNFWSYFCGFFEARDLFVIIFGFWTDLEKFVDHGLILENPRGECKIGKIRTAR